MQRSASQREWHCSHHDFKLYPLSESTYNGQYYNTDRPPRRPNKTPKTHKNLTFPRFNPDRNFATPAFILNAERNYYESEGPRMRIEHERKMDDYTQEKLEINVPKPRSKNNYCSVCKGSYEDYLDHIVSEPHKRRIHQSSFNRDIIELGLRYEGEHPKRRAKGSLEKNLSTRIEDSDEVQIISNPHKLIKRNEVLHAAQLTQPYQQQTYFPGMMMGNQFPMGTNAGLGDGMVAGQGGTFKPFSTTYQQQMNQFILNLNIILNPYPMGVLPQLGLLPPSPIEVAMQARQQLELLQFSLLNQISSCNQMQQLQLQMQTQQAPSLHLAQTLPAATPPPPSARSNYIVIDES